MTDRFADDVPDSSEQLDQLQPYGSLSHRDRGLDDVLDEGYSPPERWSAAERFGNTAAEQAAGETLEQRLAQEEPDGWDVDEGECLDDGEVGTARAGRWSTPTRAAETTSTPR